MRIPQNGKTVVNVIQAAALLPIAARHLRRHGLQTTIEWAGAGPESSRLSLDEVEMARRIGRAVNYVGRLGPYTCLDRSLALIRLMASRGMSGQLRIGAKRETVISFHAWVELHDQVINDRQEIASEYSIFEEEPAPNARFV